MKDSKFFEKALGLEKPWRVNGQDGGCGDRVCRENRLGERLHIHTTPPYHGHYSAQARRLRRKTITVVRPKARSTQVAGSGTTT